MRTPIVISILLLILAFEFAAKCNTGKTVSAPAVAPEVAIRNRTISTANAIKTYLSAHSEYNDELVFLVDMRIESGKNRFFVFNLKDNKIVDEGLVAHGSGSETGEQGKLKFSNVKNSYCTSLGKYAIGKSYNGQFGKGYQLHGLDATNNNALERYIVLHTYKSVPYDEQESPIVNSLGCPMVNSVFFERLQTILDNSDKKILLYIYY
jgi:hypothetical protein